MNQNNKPDYILNPKLSKFDIYALQERQKQLGSLVDIDCEVVESILPQKEENN